MRHANWRCGVRSLMKDRPRMQFGGKFSTEVRAEDFAHHFCRFRLILQLLQDLGKVKSVDETWKFEDRLTRAK